MKAARIIIDPPASGTWNMAVDHALLASAEQTGLVTLRIYFWSPATLSLGYFQRSADRRSHSASLGCPMVRRTSGGGAILHDNEITYSLCVPSSNRWSAQNDHLYKLAHQAMIAVLAEQGLEPRLYGNTPPDVAHSRPGNADSHGNDFLCFKRRSPGDIVIGEHKIAGSAQRRLRSSLLQHGSILLSRSDFAPELPGIRDLGTFTLSALELVGRWLNTLLGFLDLPGESTDLTEPERRVAAAIEATQFASDNWNLRR